MKLLKFFLICIIFFMSALSGYSDEVDLNKVKKKETERRKKVKKKQKVFTNASVDKVVKNSKKVRYLQMPDSATLRRANRQSIEDEKPGSRSAAGSEAVVDKKKTRKYWSERKVFLEQNIADLEKKIKEEQLKLNGLSSNLMNMDLPAQRTRLKDEVSKANYSLEKNKQLLIQYKSELEKLEEEARRSGIPAGWLR